MKNYICQKIKYRNLTLCISRSYNYSSLFSWQIKFLINNAFAQNQNDYLSILCLKLLSYLVMFPMTRNCHK